MKLTYRNKFPFIAALAGLSMFGTLHAATIVWDFNDNNGIVDTNGLSGSGVMTEVVGISTSNGTVNASIANGRAQRDLGSSTADVSATFTFTLNIGATPISLTQINFTQGLDVNAGSVATNYFKWDLVITTTGSETPGASQTTFAHFRNNNSDFTANESATLSGLDNLTNVDVTFAFIGHYGTTSNYTGGQNNNRFIYLDDVTFIGEAIPEPSAALLGGLGILFLLRRRRI